MDRRSWSMDCDPAQHLEWIKEKNWDRQNPIQENVENISRTFSFSLEKIKIEWFA